MIRMREEEDDDDDDDLWMVRWKRGMEINF